MPSRIERRSLPSLGRWREIFPSDVGKTTLHEELVFYTKGDCPLCEKSLPVARELAQRHGMGLRTTSIESDPVLEKRLGEQVPVLEFRGEVMGWGRLSLRALEREVSQRLAGGGEESSVETLEDATCRYFLEEGLPEGGGYGDRWVKVKFLGVPVVFPNTAARRRAVRYHDLHHVLTGYGTDWPGEAQISAWEIASGCRGFVAAWVLNLYAMGIGVALAPVRTYRAFLRGRQSSNLYGLALDDQLLGQRLRDARQATGLARPTEGVKPGDSLCFACWAAAAIVFASLPFVATGWALFAIATRHFATT